ncbi:MAG: DEAD/DEAH box helicase family protein [Candidatus Delongbacteria bacterium]|nr:DEAD/DEAH box helicase family protein [Candidatus Delongbacteria bacterium]
MELKLEQLEYQQKAINSIISVFKGQERNTFDNSCFEGIRSNMLSLSKKEIESNLEQIIIENGIDEKTASISDSNDLCIEMETGTGKTLVYIKTIFELFKHYGFSKFIILVPSVAIKEGVLTTFKTFEKQLEDIYNIKPDYFEYDSKRLPKVMNFIEEQNPQIMVMTLQSFNSDDRILNQAQREDLFSNMPYIEAIARTNPIVIMDEPQEGMDTENSIERLKTINPLFKIRYSATHKVLKNLVYRLTPYESYKQGLVKKIEVLTVSEKNDEASMRIELKEVKTQKGKDPVAIINAWKQTASGFKFGPLKKLEKNAKLEEITGNIIYKDYVIEQISKPIRGKGFVKFSNGAVIYEGDQAKDYSSIFSEQLYWLIDTHFRKKEELRKKGIKCLSLIFIDRVDNYIKPDGIIKQSFIDQFKKVHSEFYIKDATDKQIEYCQGYYFAKTGKGDFTDNERSMVSNKELFDLILKDKEELLDLENPVEFIFSHSALGVGWDNPNVFNIATLNQSYSEIKKRQEIGRGLRICVNQKGKRLYDDLETPENEEINLLTVIPNESYHTFVSQYQSEIEEVYGTTSAGAETRHNHKGDKASEKRIRRNEDLFSSVSFREFWNRMSRKTEYLVSFDEDRIIEESIKSLNEIAIPEHKIQISLGRIHDIAESGIETQDYREESKISNIAFSPVDLVEEISESSSLAYPTVFKIIQGIFNKKEIIKNPPRFLQEAVQRIRNIELDEMLRALEYRITNERFELDKFEELIVKNTYRTEPTPNKGIYDHIIWDSEHEQRFARDADTDTEVVCFLKLPGFYRIKTPAGEYNPDFGLVLKKKKIRDDREQEFYFVIETKGTNDINDRKALTENEIYKIKCAVKHFEALGIETKVDYMAPIKDFDSFKNKAEELTNV